jgi:GTPase
MEPTKFRCGIVALLGRPNVGKSTLLNTILGEKMASVSPKAQTTRRSLRGIYNEDNYQIIFVDTPGLHRAPEGQKLNEVCVSEALSTLSDADVYLYIIDGSRGFDPSRPDSDEGFIIETLTHSLRKNPKPLFVVLNKMDLWQKGENTFATQDLLQRELARLPVTGFFPLAAKFGQGLEPLLLEIRNHIPEGPALFDTDILTDQNMRTIAGEFIQEQLFHFLGEEVPYSCAVEINRYEDPHDNKRMTEIEAAIHVERDGQKAMVIGKGGQKIKEIGQAARKEIETLVGHKVVLKLFVKVTPRWTKDVEQLKRLGYIVPKAR